MADTVNNSIIPPTSLDKNKLWERALEKIKGSSNVLTLLFLVLASTIIILMFYRELKFSDTLVITVIIVCATILISYSFKLSNKK